MKLYTHCLICRRPLKALKMRERGMGRTCAKSYAAKQDVMPFAGKFETVEQLGPTQPEEEK